MTKNSTKQPVIERLRARQLIQDCAHEAELSTVLEKGPVSFYCGFDPTAESLHVGNLAALILMRRMQNAGHKPIVLLGSATGMIGDPSGKSEERKLLTAEIVERNLAGIERCISRVLTKGGTAGYEIVRNHEWINELSCIDFLRDVGKHFSVNMMMGKESVKARLENREQGISYTEFSYMLLQAYDFYWLHANKGCLLQIGGSDQWGNITAGIELIRRKSGTDAPQAFGFTYPLVTSKSGAKFGKSESGAVWLDAQMTSPYQFYQFWLNTEDDDVIERVRIFTDMDDAMLAELEQLVKSKPEGREAQRRLAYEMTALIHGEAEAKKAVEASAVLFGEKFESVALSTLLEIFKDVPATTLANEEIGATFSIQELLVRTGLAKSKGEAKRLVDGGGVYLNNERVTNNTAIIQPGAFIDGSVLVLRSGKKNYHLVQLSTPINTVVAD